ncbi:RDD domain containing protein [Xylanimonas cellulosilytica DSM 15894]|uniref:RDD domain containing protein n=1 Tax=Xylanimonas cellulosilytica (strain DSM 15894 / JCM 12276 / CECT 5975 / KCTC 9989 / LMG 20990 / NBRC 107835 / XIL07) TaxID=446471 RepID=D1BTS7_XYLCX|nr:RDD family protein [Xylanimonas cellulosilytica]ACZ31056.1 RDD domain containing protein [Xylanimonas cellulosilytica DSM 15894]
MASREDIGSWLDGGATPTGGGAERLGLPAEGPGSMAPLGRRVAALCVDWAVAWAVAALVARDNSFVPLAVLAVMNVVLVGSIGYTIGHRLLGLQVRVLGAPGEGTVDGAFVGFWRSTVRTVLLCVVIPAVVWDGDGRGLHDRAAGTVITRR